MRLSLDIARVLLQFAGAAEFRGDVFADGDGRVELLLAWLDATGEGGDDGIHVAVEEEGGRAAALDGAADDGRLDTVQRRLPPLRYLPSRNLRSQAIR